MIWNILFNCAHKLTNLLTLKVNHYRIVALSFWKRQLLSKISLFITPVFVIYYKHLV